MREKTNNTMYLSMSNRHWLGKPKWLYCSCEQYMETFVYIILLSVHQLWSTGTRYTIYCTRQIDTVLFMSTTHGNVSVHHLLSVHQLLSTWTRYTVHMDITTANLVHYLLVKAYRRYDVLHFSTQAVRFVGVHNFSVHSKQLV